MWSPEDEAFMSLCQVSFCNLCSLAWKGTRGQEPPFCRSPLLLPSSLSLFSFFLSPLFLLSLFLLVWGGFLIFHIFRVALWQRSQWFSLASQIPLRTSHWDFPMLIKYPVSSLNYPRSLRWWESKEKDLDEEKRNPHPATYTYRHIRFSLGVLQIEIILCIII